MNMPWKRDPFEAIRRQQKQMDEMRKRQREEQRRREERQREENQRRLLQQMWALQQQETPGLSESHLSFLKRLLRFFFVLLWIAAALFVLLAFALLMTGGLP